MNKTYHVHHILVAYDYEAQDLLKKLREGKNFAELAQKFSKCPSAARGGDLGPVKMGAADENFEEASLCLKLGQVSISPVRTRFGFHIIKRIS